MSKPDFVLDERPPMILHDGYRPRGAKAIIARCALNIHMGGRATKLLQFYGDQAQGFAPALKTVQRGTGIYPNKISEIRQQLVNFGLIKYQQGNDLVQGYILIRWLRIRTFAALTEPIRITQADRRGFKERGYNPFNPIQVQNPRIEKKLKGLDEFRKYRVQTQTELSPQEIKGLQSLERMTEKQYREVINSPRKKIWGT